MAALQALLQQLNSAASTAASVAQDPRIARRMDQCALCGVCPSDLNALREREEKTHNIQACQRRLVEMYGQDCQILTNKLTLANEEIERQRKEIAEKDARLATFDADVEHLKRCMSELERARAALESYVFKP